MTFVTASLFKHIYICSNQNQIDMKKNMGNADRVIRIIIAAVIAGLFFANIIPGVLGIVLMVLAGVFLLTSFISFCPLYAPFGISTCKKK